jgi:pyrroline-5-carboxylate reductase
MKPRKLTFIGGGNMAQAMIGGLLTKGTLRKNQVFVVDPDQQARRKVAKLGVTAVVAPSALPRPLGDLVVLAVKPQSMAAACMSIAPDLRGNPELPVLSIAAGIRLSALAGWLNGHLRLIRCMPNTPALIGAGITAVYAQAGVTRPQRRAVGVVLESVGSVVWLENEDLLDPVTAVSGSGPAYVFWLIEQLAAAGESLGLESATSMKLALETVLGSAKLAAQSKQPVAALRERVTSRGGTTEAALKKFEEERLAERFLRAVEAACQRSSALGRTLG